MDEIRFIGSFKKTEQCPDENLPEFAFIGRSNVGKSSLINMLCERKGLAKVSQTPGKTQSLNFFKVDQKGFIVDLPGYGYARVSKKDREEWEKMIRYYLQNRTQITCLFVLIDSRVTPQKNDLEFIAKLGAWSVPFALVFTKADKLNQLDVQKNKNAFCKKLKEEWTDLPPVFVTSAEKHLGKKEIWAFMNAHFDNEIVNP